MTYMLAHYGYAYLFSDWAQQFDKLKRAFTYAALTWLMSAFWLQLFNFHYHNFTESCSCLFDKLLSALMGFNLSSSVHFVCSS